ncbi:transmembrane protein 45B-like [Lytechinus variegatus]|uniref:transmembrane protein 45B-like n=1 Tax=Lytechinus variegatus TaxID=7654 RepID=UPI001BB118B2|nr:transmembrane protein 45B-like [Lytechinus variegatus]
MGTFIGHALPGAFFIIVSIWWIIQFVYTKIVLDNGRQRPRSRLMYCLHRVPIEGSLIVFGGVVGFIGEMMYPAPKWTLIDSEGHWKHQVEWQHVTMYTYFALYGGIMVMGRSCVPSVAGKYEKAFGALAFAVEGFLFHFHTHGRSDLDVQLHTMLVVAIFICFLSTSAEVWRPKDTLVELIRILFTLVQGTWFWHVGIVLYIPPGGEPWDPEDHLNVMFTTVMFTWHILVDMLVLFFFYGITKLALKMCGFSSVRYSQMSNGPEEHEVKLLGNNTEAGNHLLGGSESD